MGLDQYATSYDPKFVKNPDAVVDIEPTKDVGKEIAYWRKHPNLQGWMEKLYYNKGGEDESFNCSSVRLEKHDLERLKEDVESGSLPATSGFFFGVESDDHYKEDDLKFIEAALQEIEDGCIVLYSSWW